MSGVGSQSSPFPLILAIDDNPTNLKLIVGCLKTDGFKVLVARDGAMGIERAKLAQPALILLDVMMPHLSGFETCRSLKSQMETRDIPVIFLTALNSEEDKVKGFDAGGVDYITKPIQPKELVARVKTHVALSEMRRRLQAQNAQLEKEIAERAQIEIALREANASKDAFFSIIAHDLRSPFMGLLGLTETALHYLDTYDKEDLQSSLRTIKASTEKVYALLENLLTWSRLQRGMLDYTPRVFALAPFIANTVTLFTSLADQKQITLATHVPERLSGYADPNMMGTVLRNLISNALKFTRPAGQVTISARQTEQIIEVAVADTGIGIPAEALPKLFRIDMKVATTGTAGEKGSGIGLSLCHDLMARNNGQLWVESHPQQGTTFTFTVPCPQETKVASSTPQSASASHAPTVTHVAQSTGLPGISLNDIHERIARLPPELRYELQQAIDSVNPMVLKDMMFRTRELDAALEEILAELLFKQFRFDVLQEVFTRMNT